VRTKLLVSAFLLAAAVLAIAPSLAPAATIIFPTTRSVTGLITLQTTATTGTSDIVDIHHELNFTSVWVIWNGNCSDGTVAVQAAMTPAGPWVTVATLTHKNALPDWVLLAGSPGAIRTTITVTVVGGTVSTYLTGK
jgi:hypothetical protein